MRSGRFERRRDCREWPAVPRNEAVESRNGGRIAQDDCDGPSAGSALGLVTCQAAKM